MKGALGLIGLVALAGGGFALYSWAFSGSNDAPLTADGILIFDSAKAVEQHYGFIGKTYSAAIPAWADETVGRYGARRSEFFDHYFRIRFMAERPASIARSDALAELNRVRAQKGKKLWSSAALNQAQLYTVAADADMTGGKRGHMVPDVTMFQRQDESILTGLKVLFTLNTSAGVLSVDPGDPHVLMLAQSRDINAIAITMRFSGDWSKADISIPDSANGPGVKTTAVLEQTGIPEGAYRARLTITALQDGMGQAPAFPQYEYPRVREAGLLNPTIPLYFHPDGDYSGKAYLAGKTYRIHAAQRDGALKIFLDDDGMLSFDPTKPTTTVMRLANHTVVGVLYTATLEKAQLDGKEAQLAANYSALGSVPETVVGAPNVWGTYFPDLGQAATTPARTATKPVHTAAPSQAHSVSPAKGKEVFVMRPRAVAPAKAAAPDPNRQKTDAEIEAEMQLAHKQRKY